MLSGISPLAVAARTPAIATPTPTPTPTPEAETTALIARMSSPPDSTRQGHINTFIKALKDGGVWSKMDVLFVFASHDAQSSLLDWKNLGGSGAYDATVVLGAPTFTTDRGYTGDASNRLTTAYTVGSGIAVNDSGHISCFVADATATTQNVPSLNSRTTLSTDESVAGRWQAFTNATAPAGSPPHMITAVRRGATSSYAFRNAVAGSESTLTVNAGTGVALMGNGVRTQAIVSFGDQLSDVEVLAYYNAAKTYLTALGVSGL